MKDKFPLVEVEWVDAGLESHNLSLEDARELKSMLRKNAGYLLRRDKKKVVLCAGFIEDKGMRVCDQTLVIPGGCVKAITCLASQ